MATTDPKVRVTNIAFDEDENPSEVTVVLPIAVAAHLAKYAGGRRGSDEGYEHTTQVWEALTGMVFNAFWEDGLDGYYRGGES